MIASANPPPSVRRSGWYRGDLHLHTIHSDGERHPSELVSDAQAGTLPFDTVFKGRKALVAAGDDMLLNQMHQRLRAVFEALPEQEQRCLYLRAEGLKYRDIARVLNISLGAVSASLSRALARMTRATRSE